MGTNYYWRHNLCEHCGRYDELHICKSYRTFRGHFHEGDWDDELKTFPLTPIATSWQQWKTLLASDGQVWDEYDRRIDTALFIADVEATDPSARRRQYDYVRTHLHRPQSPPHEVRPGGDWLDADGFSFHGGEFS